MNSLSNRRIFALGETVYDIIFRNNKPVGGCPGGSVLNTAVSLGKIKLPVYLISEYGNDLTGKAIDSFLIQNGINTDFIYKYNNGKTPVAIAFLDSKNNASYDFYKIMPAERLSIKLPDFTKNDILILSSFFTLTKDIRSKVKDILNKAKQAGTLIFYDPNFRKPHQKDLPDLIDNINENIHYADIIRASDEDCKLIFDLEHPDDVFDEINDTSKVLIYTTSKYAYFQNFDLTLKIDSPKINPVSTIGAGDSFNAGIINSIIRNNIFADDLLDLEKPMATNLLKSGINFATDVCMSMENYISDEFAGKLLQL